MKYILEKKELALEIRKTLKIKKISQSELARKLEITRSSISITLNNLEDGKAISLNTLLEYSRVLDVSFVVCAK
ncbi:MULTISPECIES: helix-turn-helix transcriptional regulator [Psychrilyobacter]|uniref:HTH cro/C1-type domain-containing protein n=1 Tax=Psychrilyobacter piezotolerans TaxID=2293438 RepID=A0ABX9KJJ1_9FUSO|nr:MULTISPECIES: helix-turn-helix domain-containing protein [Psychrilyobacter]MCS5422208.1 helix-turn-helix domain-containing protein [Psychrilyobacter sp. S5]NDI77144.1 XRE family transcriptional regulator [Psychrilyobacter piezotolerans]RDE64136.1 hypothetical protein DV867_04195 [Psychrilyobacter sp. S5]REI42228.1 hypothetical protein DYH56_04195 [Psychrilyobacter piezotolerans]